MFKLLTKVILVTILLSGFFLSGAAYGSKAVGSAKALVVNKILGIGDNAGQKNSISLNTDLEGNVFYKIQSEPNSVVNTCYQVKNHNKSATNQDRNLAKKSKSNNSNIVLDNNGNGLLAIDSRLLLANNTNSDRDVVYYVDLFY